jgi:hypothetical protein
LKKYGYKICFYCLIIIPLGTALHILYQIFTYWTILVVHRLWKWATTFS